MNRIIASLAIVCIGCAGRQAPRPVPLSLLVGDFVDDYAGSYTISADTWSEGLHGTYHIILWNESERYVLARNSDRNETEPGLFSRFDWVQLNDGGQWTWAYCHSAWKAATEQAALSAATADRVNPRLGCHGNPFTRMRRR